MSRSGYSDDLDNWDLIRWRGQVASAIRGKRGQAFLLELVRALDRLPEKRLIAGELKREPKYAETPDELGISGQPLEEGGVCMLGAVGQARGMDVSGIDIEDYENMGSHFGIAAQLAQEIMWLNDEAWWRATPEERWRRAREWAISNLLPVPVCEIAPRKRKTK